MNPPFVDRLPVVGYREIDGRDLAFARVWNQPCLHITFSGGTPSLIGRVTHLDGMPRLVAAPDNLAWPCRDDPSRSLAVLGPWSRRGHGFRARGGQGVSSGTDCRARRSAVIPRPRSGANRSEPSMSL